jgi:hypothetical protein
MYLNGRYIHFAKRKCVIASIKAVEEALSNEKAINTTFGHAMEKKRMQWSPFQIQDMMQVLLLII